MKQNTLIILSIFFSIKIFAQNESIRYIGLGDSCSYDSDSSNILAMKYYSVALQFDSNCVECYLKRAWRNKNNSEEIISDLKKAIQIDPNCAECHSNLADHLSWTKKEYKLGRHYYYEALRVLTLKTNQDSLLQNRIIDCLGNTLYYELGDHEKGQKASKQLKIHIYDSLIKINPNPEYYLKRADNKANYYINDFKGGLEDYMYLYKSIENRDINLLWNIAFCNSELGNYFEAIQYYNKVVDSREYILEKSKLYRNRANCKEKLNDYRGAIDDYQLAISTYSTLSPYTRLLTLYNSIARMYLLLNNYQTALTILNKAISVSNDGVTTINISTQENVTNEDLAYTYFLIGHSKYNLKNTEGACKAWSKSGELGYSDAYVSIKNYCK